jgi:serine/threonine protein phosphatase 1
MIWIIGDIHGCAKTFEALLAQLPSDEPKVLCGDLVDRGPDSKRVVELAIENRIQSVMGNHELMLLSGVVGGKFSCPWGSGTWYRNGADTTWKSYGDSIPTDHVDWIASLPHYLEFPELVDDSGRRLFVSHSAYHGGFHGKLPSGDPWDDYSSILWNRRPEAESKVRFCVHGHTPLLKGVKVRASWANIDGGCVFHGSPIKDYKTGTKRVIPFQGKLTALRFPDKKIVQQLCIDEVTRGS